MIKIQKQIKNKIDKYLEERQKALAANQNKLILGHPGHGTHYRWFKEEEFRIEWTPSYVKDILVIINKKTGTKIYHWIDDYGRNEVKPFKDLKKYKIENDDIKYEVIENPNYHCNVI